jgi:hypothetical protein
MPVDLAAVPQPVLNAARQFDKFALAAVRKSVADVTNNLAQSNKTVAARFAMAAKRIDLTPESQLTGEILSDPARAETLGRGAGIGTDLSDEGWQQAHEIAVETSRTRQAKGLPAPPPEPATAAHTAVIYCAVVLKPPPEITRDPAYNPDGWLALREKPDRRSKMLHALRAGDYLYVGSEKCWKGTCDTYKREWVHVAGVLRIDGRDAPEKDYKFGWVRHQYVQEFECPEDQQDQAQNPMKDGPEAAVSQTQATDPQRTRDFPKWLGIGP